MNLFQRPTFAEIDLDALKHNFLEVRRLCPKMTKILAVVKADAYGHGAVFISKELEKLKVDFLGVSYLEEALELKKAGIKSPILILGGIFPGQAGEVVKNQFIPSIFDLTIAQELNKAAQKQKKRLKVHIKIDTGMGRLGITPDKARYFFTRMVKFPYLSVEGLFSHLSVASEENDQEVEFTREQFRSFHKVINICKESGIHLTYLHLANSAAIIKRNFDGFNLVRPGIILYGSYPSPLLQGTLPLKPVMNLKSKILLLKKLPRGHSVSYGRTFVCRRDTRIAIVPIGYSDGYNFLLSNCGNVLIKGKRAPVIGRVCMDHIMVDVTEIPGLKLWDEVILMGQQGNDMISAQELAEKTGTIPYEILCRIGQRVPRIYIRERKVLKCNY